MSVHLAMLRRAHLDGELFGGRSAAAAPPRASGGAAGAGPEPWPGLFHELFLRAGGRQAVGLAAPSSGEGASYVAARLAAEAARACGGPALLLEANLRRSSQAQLHGVEPEPGLSRFLLDKGLPLESCLRQTAAPALWVLPGGPATTEAPDWTRLAEAVAGLRRRFAAIVVDLPPVNLSPEVAIVTPLLDGVVLVVEADHSSREVIRSAEEKLRRANPNLLGAVMNKRKFFVPEPIYRRL